MKLQTSRISAALTLTMLILVFAATTRVATAQTFADLYEFKGRDGLEPFALVQATNGDLYGTTFGGGAYSKGTVFEINRTLQFLCRSILPGRLWPPIGSDPGHRWELVRDNLRWCQRVWNSLQDHSKWDADDAL
jgi:uncharacterized repeat protein (TIGR03803 family)